MHRRILNFPSQLLKKFLDALEKEITIPLALLARGQSLICAVSGEDAWWIFGVGAANDGWEVIDIASLVSRECEWVMDHGVPGCV